VPRVVIVASNSFDQALSNFSRLSRHCLAKEARAFDLDLRHLAIIDALIAVDDHRGSSASTRRRSMRLEASEIRNQSTRSVIAMPPAVQNLKSCFMRPNIPTSAPGARSRMDCT
jgi:hypothetical protein